MIAPPIHLCVWSVALILWLPFEYEMGTLTYVCIVLSMLHIQYYNALPSFMWL